jgi:HAD superfamily hydrolase (TIGR01509 family)
MTDIHTQIGETQALVAGVTLLCLDAGNTVIFLDHERLAAAARLSTFQPTRTALEQAEGRAKIRAESDSLLHVSIPGLVHPGATSWARMVSTILEEATASLECIVYLLPRLWEEHVRLNFWSRVPANLPAALRSARSRGIRVVIVSNSEGMLEPLFAELGISDCFDRILDSGKLGIEKPDPKIFEMALQYAGVDAGQALHLGDVFATDVVGARAAGIRVGLIDPYNHYAGRHLDVLRVEGVTEVAELL